MFMLHSRSSLFRASLLVLLAISSVADGQEGLRLTSPTGETPSVESQPIGTGVPTHVDAVGTLFKVKRTDTGKTRFALMDESGKIVAFVAPTARFDLKRYLGEDVAISARTFGQQDDIAPSVILDRISLASEGGGGGLMAATGQVARVSHDQMINEPPRLMAPSGASGQIIHEPAWTATSGETVIADPIGVTHGPMMIGETMDGCVDGCVGGCVGGCDCPSCGGCYVEGASCETCSTCTACGPCQCGPPGWLWIRGEYLAWWADGMELPPMVTTSDPQDGGILMPGNSTEILFGNESVLTNDRSGYRIRFGGFFGPQRKIGWEADYFDVGTLDQVFFAESDGNLVLARPFFNINPRDDNGNPLPAGPDAELVSFPGQFAGSIAVSTYSQFRGAGARVVKNLCCKQCPRPCGHPCGPYGTYAGCGPCGGPCRGCGYPPYMKVDFTVGYRYANLQEGLIVDEDLTTIGTIDGGRIEIQDRFLTRNDFNGGEVGTAWEGGWNRWTLEMLMRVALGSTKQEVTIDGNTRVTPFPNPPIDYDRGVFALPTNIGNYSQNQFSANPELATTLGLYLTPRLRVTLGYTFMYWSSVVRPGDQIDLDLNPDYFAPPTDPITGAARPAFVFRTTDFWAQGINVGLDYRW